jgi:alkanesulfonate monooxygenase SsuD/methylene tetrahydromethanopterin reductase-like flavin-dependent oxidoreductase (luciferase family)
VKIGIAVMLVNVEGGETPHFDSISSTARLAEQEGFDSIWLYDHLLYRFGNGPTMGIWECWSMLSALAAVTERVELGTLVICNSFRNPALLAKMAETVDEISNGRLILGIGAGWNKPEYDAFGYPFSEIRHRFEEAAQIIEPLLKERRLDGFDGKYYRVDDCEIVPRGPREAGVPLLIGAMGPRMMRLAARHATIWNAAYTGNADTFAYHIDRFRDACRSEGRDPDSIEFSALANVAFEDIGGVLPAPIEDDLALPDSALNQPCLTGSEEEMALELKKYEALGTSHLMFQISPDTQEAVRRLADVVKRYRSL